MTNTVSMASILCMAVSGLAGFGLPVVLFFWFRRKKGADVLPFFTGCGVMLVFAFLLEQGVHSLVLGSAAGAAIQGNIWLYALYGGLMAGLFEETGRFLAFKTLLRRRRDKDVNALMYGAGHGGFEAAVLLGLTRLGGIILAAAINSGHMEADIGTLSGVDRTQMEALMETLVSTPAWLYLLGAVERVFAVILHLSLSVLVWFAAKEKGQAALYPLAILLHFLADGITALLSGLGVPSLPLEGVVGLCAAACALLARRVWERAGNSSARES